MANCDLYGVSCGEVQGPDRVSAVYRLWAWGVFPVASIDDLHVVSVKRIPEFVIVNILPCVHSQLICARILKLLYM